LPLAFAASRGFIAMSALLACLALMRWAAPPTDSADPKHLILRRGRNCQLEWRPDKRGRLVLAPGEHGPMITLTFDKIVRRGLPPWLATRDPALRAQAGQCSEWAVAARLRQNATPHRNWGALGTGERW